MGDILEHANLKVYKSFSALSARCLKKDIGSWIVGSSVTNWPIPSGELVRFQAGITMEISQLDAWYSSKDGSLEGPATYIVRGLCRRCCIPEVILGCMQVSVSLMESGNPHESHDELIELVALPETGFLHLFSQQQLQEFLLLEREYCICKLELGDELPC
ncbi:hypothetical protein ACSBR1_018351 [Camellia fascicularis]